MPNNDDENEEAYWKTHKTVGTPSVSGASGPSKAAPSVEYSSNALGKTKTVYDGNTPTKYDAEDPTRYSAPADPFLPSNRGGGGFQEKEHYAPCINPSCKSYGKSHPNCKCYAGPGGTSLEGGMFAHGGVVGQYCSGAHKEGCEHYADGGTIFENTQIHNNPSDTLGHIAIHHGLHGILTKTGHSKSENKNKPNEDYIEHARKGHKQFHNHMENMFTNNHLEPDKISRESLKSHLSDLHQNPSKILDVGGSIDFPGHAAHLGALAGTSLNYFNSIKPKQSKVRPLDQLSPVDKKEQAIYDRHIDLAQNPMLIMQHVKDGKLLPSDLSTLNALYPTLHNKMKEKAFEALVGAKEKGIEIPYKQKQSLSLLMGEPLDSTMTSQSMQAIIKSAGPQQAQQQQKAQAKPKKASGVELNQLNKVNAMSATSLQDRLMDKAKH